MIVAIVAGTLGQGGAERQLFLLAKALFQNGDKIHVYSLTQGEFWESKLINEGIEVTYFGEKSSRLTRLFELYSQIKNNRPDLIYSFHFYTSIYAGLVGRLLGVFSIGSIRNNGVEEKSKNGAFSFIHFHLPHAIICNSEHAFYNIKNLFLIKKRKVGILRNAVEIYESNDIQPRKDQFFNILFVGRLEAQKRPMLFLEIICFLKTECNLPIKAKIIGQGSMKALMIDYCEKQGLLDDIKFFGNIPVVVDQMKKSDVLLFTSEFEGTPNVVLEAMSIGLPVVSSHFEGVESLLGSNEERGYVFTSKEEAAQIVLVIKNSPNKRMINTAKNFISKNYSSKNLVNQFYSLMSSFKTIKLQTFQNPEI